MYPNWKIIANDAQKTVERREVGRGEYLRVRVVGVRGRVKKNFEHECYQNVYVFFFRTTHGQLSGDMSQVGEVISLRIVTARNFFALHNNHPFNHNLGAKYCSSAERKRDALFLSCFHCSWTVASE